MNRSIAIVVVLAAAAGVAAWLLRGSDVKGELELGGYVEAEQIQVGSRLGGRVVRIGEIHRPGEPPVLIDEGTEVEAGQELVVFETDEIEAQLDEARFDLKQAEAKLALLHEWKRDEEKDAARARVELLKSKRKITDDGPRPQEIEQARLAWVASKATLTNAESEYKRIVALTERSAGSAADLDAARKKFEVAQQQAKSDEQKHELLREGNRPEEKAMARHQLEEAEAALALAENGPRPHEVEQAEAAVDAAKARIRRLDVLLAEGVVKAPLPCTVEAFDLQPGDLVAPGAPLATLVRKDQLWVRAFIPETDLGFVRDGQPVEIKVDSFPARRFRGTVLRVNRLGEFTPRNVQTFKERQDMLFGIKVRVDDPDHQLRPGMAATVVVMKKS